MQLKMIIFLICSYLIAFTVNLIPSLKHPDATLSIINLLGTVLFLVASLIFVKKSFYNGKSNKGLKTFLILGITSGLVVYVVNVLENTIMNHFLLDAIASIQYPFYLMFTTPLFGLNVIFNTTYENFSLLMSAIYVITFILSISLKKSNTPSV